MDATVKYFLDLENQDDVDILHDILGDLSDLEGASDDDGNSEEVLPQPNQRRQIRVGADQIGQHDVEQEESFVDDEPQLDSPTDPIITLSPNQSSTEATTASTSRSKKVAVPGPTSRLSNTAVASSSNSSPSISMTGENNVTELNNLLSEYFAELEKAKKTIVARGKPKKIFTVQWSKKGLPNNDLSTDLPHPGEQLPSSFEENAQTPLDLYLKYIPQSFFESTSFFTNLYAVQQETRKFTPSTAEEIKKLVGLHIIMGTLKYPRVRMYWDSNLKIKVFPETMKRDRFFQLRTHLHVVDNTAPRDSNDKFFKVRPLYDSIRNQCVQMPLEEQLAIDEQMVPFRGKFDLLQYVKGKPCPWGIKIFFMCGKSGYPYDFIIYQGASTEFDAAAKKHLGMTASVVYTLASRRICDGQYHELYYDNYFSSYHLLRLLKKMNINAAGTIRTNRFFSPGLTPESRFLKLVRGTSEEVANEFDDVAVVQWLDNKCVFLASNFIGIGEEDEVRRWDKSSRTYITIKRPEIIKKYNHAMGGVDLLDQLIGLYRIFIRSRKWTLRMLFHGFELAIICAFKEYKKLAAAADVPTAQQYDLLAFRMRLAEQLIQSSPEPRKRGRRPSIESSRTSDETLPKRRNGAEFRPFDEVVHDQIGHLAHHDDKDLPTRCKNNGCNYKSHVQCLKCEVHLCLNKSRNCFSQFHAV